MAVNDLSFKIKDKEVDSTNSSTGTENNKKNFEPIGEVEAERTAGGMWRIGVLNNIFKLPGTGDVNMQCPHCNEEIILDSKKLGLADGEQSGKYRCIHCNKYFEYKFLFEHNSFLPSIVLGSTWKIKDQT